MDFYARGLSFVPAIKIYYDPKMSVISALRAVLLKTEFILMQLITKFGR